MEPIGHTFFRTDCSPALDWRCDIYQLFGENAQNLSIAAPRASHKPPQQQ